MMKSLANRIIQEYRAVLDLRCPTARYRIVWTFLLVVLLSVRLTAAEDIPRDRLTVSADSQELTGENGRAANAIDGQPATFWITPWTDLATAPRHPHWLLLQLPSPTPVTGLTYVPRQDMSNGRIRDYRVWTSMDGQTWQEVARGTMPDTTGPKVMSWPAREVRYVKLESLSEVNGDRYAGAAEVTLQGRPPPPPAPTTPAIHGPALAVSQRIIAITVANGRSDHPRDTLHLCRAGADASDCLAWKYLNGSTKPPPQGRATATVTFQLPEPEGRYEVRLYADGTRDQLLGTTPLIVRRQPTEGCREAMLQQCSLNLSPHGLMTTFE